MSPRPPIAKLIGRMQHNAWGARDAIARLRGEGPAASPEAELWFGDHVRDPSCVEVGGEQTPIAAWLDRWGTALTGAGQTGLPVLVKILAAAEPLSIQVHPDAETARTGHGREDRAGTPVHARERSYRDPHPKLEVLCALGEVEALCGLRPFADVERDLGRASAEALRALLEGARSTADVFLRVLCAADDRIEPLLFGLRQLASEHAPGTSDRRLEWVRVLLERHPGEAMAIAPLLLNLVRLADGEALVVSPGTVHAYLEGVGVEVMTPSDNVVRAGLTTSHVDRAEFERLLDRISRPAEIATPAPTGPDTVRAYATSIDAFELARIDLETGVAGVAFGQDRPGVVLCTRGRVEVVSTEGEVMTLGPTEAALVPAAHTQVDLRGAGTAFLIR